MHLQNNFSDETRALFIFNYSCFWCGTNGQDALHHILGRVSDSPLNACPIHNHKCHIGNGSLATFEVQKKLLQKTFNYLKSNGYSLTTDDKMFIRANARYYKNISHEES